MWVTLFYHNASVTEWPEAEPDLSLAGDRKFPALLLYLLFYFSTHVVWNGILKNLSTLFQYFGLFGLL